MVERTKCPNCAAPMSGTEPFCGNCGAGVDLVVTRNDEHVPRVEFDTPNFKAGDSWISSGPAGPNQVYLGQRLSYGAVDESMSGLVSSQMLRAVYVRMAVLWTALFVFGIILGGLVFAITRSAGTATTVLFISFLTAVASWFFPARLPVSEWNLLLDARASAAESAFGQIASSLERRGSPVKCKPRRVASPITGSRPRLYLELRYERFEGYASAFSYGEDLYIGWTLWWRITPAVMVYSFLKQLVAGIIHSSAAFHYVLRSDEMKAFREVVHSAVREGVDRSAKPVTPESRRYAESIPLEDGPLKPVG